MRRLWLVLALMVVLLTSGCLGGGGGPSAESIVKQRAQAIQSAETLAETLTYFSNPIVIEYDITIDGLNNVFDVVLTHEQLIDLDSNDFTADSPGESFVGDLVVSVSGSNATSTQAISVSGIDFGGKTVSGSATVQFAWTNTSGEWKVHTVRYTMNVTSD